MIKQQIIKIGEKNMKETINNNNINKISRDLVKRINQTLIETGDNQKVSLKIIKQLIFSRKDKEIHKMMMRTIIN